MIVLFPSRFLHRFLAPFACFLFSVCHVSTVKIGNNIPQPRSISAVDVFPTQETNDFCLHPRKQPRFLAVSSWCFLKGV